MRFPRPVKTIYEGGGVKGVTRAPKEVLQRVVDQLNAAADSRERSKGMAPLSSIFRDRTRYTSSIQEAHAANLTGLSTRPRVVTRDGQAFLVLHRGVSSGGKHALSGSKYQGKWGDAAAAPGFPTSTHRGVAKKFAGDSPTELRRARSAKISKAKSILEQGERLGIPKDLMSDSAEIAAISRGRIRMTPDLKPSSRGKMRTKKPRPNVGTYLLPESEIKNAWVRPESAFGPEWEVRHPQVGEHLTRLRKYFSAKLRLRELALGAGSVKGVLSSYRKARRKMPFVKVTRDQGEAMWMPEQKQWWGLRKFPLSERAGTINVPRGEKNPLAAFFHEAGHVVHGHGGVGMVQARRGHLRKTLNHERAANRAARKLAGKAGDEVAKANRPFFNTYRKDFIKILNGGNAPALGQTKEILRQNPYLRGYGFSAKLRLREFGSMSYMRLVRKMAKHVSREGDHVLVSKLPNAPGHPSVKIESSKPSYTEWWNRENYLLNKLAYKSNHGRFRQIMPTEARDLIAKEASRSAKANRFRGPKEFERGDYAIPAKLRLREFSALRKRIRVNWHSDGSARMTIPNQYGGVNEIGRIETSGKGRGGIGQIKWVEINDKFQGMGLASKLYGEAMKAAPRGRLVSDTEQFSPATAVWEKLRRNKGYKIRENPDYDFGIESSIISRNRRPLYVGRINPAARKRWAREMLPLSDQKKFRFSAKLRLRELALGAGTRIRHIPLLERRAIAKKLREAFPGEPSAKGGQVSGVVGLPRMIRTDAGGDMILSYRAASQKQRLVFPHSHLGPLADPDAKELRKSKAGIKTAVNNRGHQIAPQDASIGTTTSRFFVGTLDGRGLSYGGPYLGVYATPISKIPSRVEAGKVGFPNLNATKAGQNRQWEAEVAQPNGGNIIAVRESIGRNEVGDTWGERGSRDKFVEIIAKRNNRRLSAELRLRKLEAIL